MEHGKIKIKGKEIQGNNINGIKIKDKRSLVQGLKIKGPESIKIKGMIKSIKIMSVKIKGIKIKGKRSKVVRTSSRK